VIVCIGVPWSATPPAATAFSGDLNPVAPISQFVATPTIGSAPLTVTFTDLSTESPTAWAWDVDNDGTVDYTTRNCSHTYTEVGTYTVSLNASNAVGSNVMTKPDLISVGVTPVNVNMDIPYNKTLLDTPMWFNATADGAMSYRWDFGDGTNSTAQNVSKSFTAEGDYFVTLTATNEFGDTTIGREVQARRNVFTSGVEWTQATASAEWGGRYGHTSVVYDDKMWVMGGLGGGRDVWWSTDGITWTQATASAEWGWRYGHTYFVYDDKMSLI
jgi:PKD repeat protein